ncbi:peptide MFS transporter [Sphingoaurantiacus capsulatus]|uniref:Peptide MFS transporter n=1 Tax=Sphingoaurantiacus capsulatus TaxID=1771310 RepID=A0ABV7XDT2_9SPHN
MTDDAHLDRSFLGHPKGLAYLAFTEAWERFSYYGMQALLVLYLVNHLLLPENAANVALLEPLRSLYGGLDGQPFASAIVGTYFALVYFTPIVGGFIADRYIGKRRAVLTGAIIMTLGHFLMAAEAAFLFALLCLIIGSGLLKGNIAGQVGALYKPDDLRRADAFQIFYLGINAGAIAAPLVVGTLGEKVGWHWGFGAAGIGMLIALAIYIDGQNYLPVDHLEPRKKGAEAPVRPPLTRPEWLSLLAIILLIPVLAVAIVPNNQIFNAYLTWGDTAFDLTFDGEKLPTTWLVTLDAVVSVSLLAGVALFYRWYGKHWREPDEATKLVIGSIFSVGGMLCLVAAAATTPEGQKIPMAWPVLFHFVNSIGFAHILPVSLAFFARLAPPAINSTALGLYYLAFFAANSLVGYVGGYLSTMPITSFWLLHAAFAAGAGVVFLLFKLFLMKRLVGEKG